MPVTGDQIQEEGPVGGRLVIEAADHIPTRLRAAVADHLRAGCTGLSGPDTEDLIRSLCDGVAAHAWREGYVRGWREGATAGVEHARSMRAYAGSLVQQYGIDSPAVVEVSNPVNVQVAARPDTEKTVERDERGHIRRIVERPIPAA